MSSEWRDHEPPNVMFCFTSNIIHCKMCLFDTDSELQLLHVTNCSNNWESHFRHLHVYNQHVLFHSISTQASRCRHLFIKFAMDRINYPCLVPHSPCVQNINPWRETSVQCWFEQLSIWMFQSLNYFPITLTQTIHRLQKMLIYWTQNLLKNKHQKIWRSNKTANNMRKKLRSNTRHYVYQPSSILSTVNNVAFFLHFGKLSNEWGPHGQKVRYHLSEHQPAVSLFSWLRMQPKLILVACSVE